MNVKKNFKHFSPRTGISWRLDEQSVVRAGYGASTIPFPDNRYAFNYPVKQNYNGTAANGAQAQGSMAAGFPAPALLAIPDTGLDHHRGDRAAERHARRDPDRPERGDAPVLERRLPASAAVPASADIAYVGNRGVDLVMDVDLNAGMVYNAGNAGRPQFAQFNRTGTSRERTNRGKTTYHGLQMKIDRRFRKGLMVTNSYTLSRGRELRRRERRHRHADRLSKSWGRAGFDRTHNYARR